MSGNGGVVGQIQKRGHGIGGLLWSGIGLKPTVIDAAVHEPNKVVD